MTCDERRPARVRVHPLSRAPGHRLAAHRLRMFKRHRAAWVLLYLGYLIAILVLTSLPFVGPFVMLILRPVFAVGFSRPPGIRSAAARRDPASVPGIPHQPVGAACDRRLLRRRPRRSPFPLASLVDGGKLLEFMALGGSLSAEQLATRIVDGQLRLGMLALMLFALPVVIAAWWAPALVVFQDAGAAASLAASLRTALANWKALALYGSGVFLYGSLLPRCSSRSWRLPCRHPTSALARDGAARSVLALPRHDPAHLGLRKLPRRLPRQRDVGAPVARSLM